ncbi:MAG TPA: CFI-box-CTERM domain-containing protein [Desulfopila sp.]|nr:CFI-box-CTERM domain-containing protein [Desulfopila sp.]
MNITACRFQRYAMALMSILLLMPAAALGGYIQDPDFGDGGVRQIDIGNLDDRGYAAVVQTDGKILVAGTSEEDPTVKVAVIRLNEDGTLDTTFQNDGKATFMLGSGDAGANDVALKADGSILTVGFLEPDVDENKQIALMQITPTGLEDLSFGPGGTGIVTLVDGENSGEAFDVAIDGQGRILVAGQLWSEDRSWAVVARYSGDGLIDSSFGVDGYRRIETESDSAASFVGVQSSGKIIVGGTSQQDSLKTAVLYRLNEDGSIDADYGTEGHVLLGGFDADSEFFDAVLLSDDSLVATGYTTANGQTSITAARFTPTGELDASFGTDGVHISDLGNSSRGYSVAVKTDGTLLLAGEGGGEDGDIVLVDLDASGTSAISTILRQQAEDAGVAAGNGGSDEAAVAEDELIAAMEAGRPLLTDVGGDDSGRSVVITDEGMVLVAGFTGNGVSDDMVVVAYTADQPPPVGPGGVVDSGEQPYFIATLSVTNVTRNSAMSGGVISVNDSYQCDDAEDESCPPAVVLRGVAYGVAAYPSYSETADGEGGAGTTTTVANTDGSTTASVFPNWVDDSASNSVIVRRGQTEDGSSKGVYGSDLTNITPDTFYFVRAYAVLADDTVIYGNQLAFKTDDACFIATAAYGSALQPHVAVLSKFRDRYLKTTEAGRSFVRLYYRLSPELAGFIGQSSLLRLAVRIVLWPLVAFSYFMVSVPLQLKFVLLLVLGAGLFSCNPVFIRKKR